MVRLGIDCVERGDGSEAERLFGAAAEAGNAEAMNRYGVLLAKRGDSAGAEEWYRKAAATGNITGAYNVGFALRSRGKDAEAEGWFRKAADADYLNAIWGLGLTLVDLGRPDEAEGLFHKAARRGDVDAMNRYGLSMDRQGDVARAEEWYREAAEAGLAVAMYNLGITRRQRGDTAEAEQWLRKAVEAGYEQARYELARTLEALERFEEAEELFRTLAESGDDKAAERLAELRKRRPAPSALYTYLLQIENAAGDWCTLRDPHTGELEFLGTVTVEEKKLPGIAQEVMAKFGSGGPGCRVVFYLGDCTGRTKLEDGRYGYTVTGPERRIVGRNLADDNVYGVVGRGGDRLEPGPAHRRAGPPEATELTEHPVCGLRVGMGKPEVVERIGPPTRSMTSKQLQATANVLGAGEGGEEPEEYWLYRGGDAAPEGFIFEVLIRSERLATVRVKPLGPDGGELATVIRIKNGLQAVSPYREALGAQPADW